ncbi:hypothetical protein DDN37_15940 [Vibrio cholerae]|nr:hypothetical protein [Vibrio cholerae]EGR4479337.1 hypothetical protein [Vibrio cholerae]KFD97153.1 hypothetical protein DN34_3302 [Vibrio cholerae]BCZ99264.1 hypothetical protein V130003_02470 [Vibrio cholerae]GHZ64293.1 hypothetical protein VCSRO126_2981 [Vibrio cholerae]
MVNVSELLINTVSRDERKAIVVSTNYPLGRLVVANALTKRYMAGYLFYIWGYADSCAIGG